MSIPNTDDLERANWYLERISPDIEREKWVRVLMALKNTFGDSGMLLAQGWSANSPKFNARDFRDTWESLVYGGPIGIGSLSFLCGEKPTAPKQQKGTTEEYAKTIWAGASDDPLVTLQHPYAQRKNLKLHHVKAVKRAKVNGRVVGKESDCLIVPMYDGDPWAMSGVECINAEGVKQTFGRKGAYRIGNPVDTVTTHISEGWATTCAIWEMFPDDGHGFLGVFGKANLNRWADWERQQGRNVYVHTEGDDGRDGWDFWNEGLTEPYRQWVLR